MFLPSTKEEINKLGWKQPDIILVNGDAYIDSPYSGIAVIGKTLYNAGYKVAIISQPSIESDQDIMRLGSPRLFWGVSAGTTDSLVANYTASGKKRRSCDFTPGGINNKRPDRATIIYTNLIKRFDKEKKPVVLGGIEASLRRMAHYDMLTDKIRRPILFDAKADYLIYGMGELPVIELAKCLDSGDDPSSVKGLCYIAKDVPENAVVLPSYEEASADKNVFYSFFKEFYHHSSTASPAILAQAVSDRFIIQNPPSQITPAELDAIYELDYERQAHPYDRAKGEIKALATAQHSITTHRGCFGECNFCAIAVHQGRAVVSRSKESIIREAKAISSLPSFKGEISDVGGATANMYGTECPAMKAGAPCKNKRCLYPAPCPSLKESQKRYTELLADLRKLPEIKRIRVSSGIRTDLAIADSKYGRRFISDLAKYHTGGQIKLAPEHADDYTLGIMGKCGLSSLMEFIRQFRDASAAAGKKQFVTCYFMAAHPGSSLESMRKINQLASKLGFMPEQAQIFTPTPSTWSTCMYHTDLHFQTGAKIRTVKSLKDKTAQLNAIQLKPKA